MYGIQFNNITFDQMKRLDTDIGIHPAHDRIFNLEPNAYNVMRLSTGERALTKDQISIIGWLMQSMSPWGVIAVWTNLVNVTCWKSPTRDSLAGRINELRDVIVPHVIRVTGSRFSSPFVERSRLRYNAYTGAPPKLQKAYAALHSLMSDRDPIKKGASFTVTGFTNIEHGAVDATVLTAQNEVKNVILFPDEIRELTW